MHSVYLWSCVRRVYICVCASVASELILEINEHIYSDVDPYGSMMNKYVYGKEIKKKMKSNV